MNAEIGRKTAVPFSFERTFDRDGKSVSAPPKRKMMSIEEIDAVRRDAHEAGRREGEASAAQRQAEALGVLAQRVDALVGNVVEAVAPARTEAVTLAYVIALKIAQVLLQQYPRSEIEALIAQCVEEHKSEPHIVLRINDALHDDIRAFSDQITAARGFQGRIHVIGEPDIAPGDCTIEWADGGLERKLDGALRQIDQIVRGYLVATGEEGQALPVADDIMSNPTDEQLSLLASDSEGAR